MTGCPQKTREGKPYCSDHVELMPYVAGLLGVMKDSVREGEILRMRGSRAKATGFYAREALVYFFNSERPISTLRLASLLKVDPQVGVKVARALQRAGALVVVGERRGDLQFALRDRS